MRARGMQQKQESGVSCQSQASQLECSADTNRSAFDATFKLPAQLQRCTRLLYRWPRGLAPGFTFAAVCRSLVPEKGARRVVCSTDDSAHTTVNKLVVAVAVVGNFESLLEIF